MWAHGLGLIDPNGSACAQPWSRDDCEAISRSGCGTGSWTHFINLLGAGTIFVQNSCSDDRRAELKYLATKWLQFLDQCSEGCLLFFQRCLARFGWTNGAAMLGRQNHCRANRLLSALLNTAQQRAQVAKLPLLVQTLGPRAWPNPCAAMILGSARPDLMVGLLK